MPAPDLDRFTSRRSTVYGSRGVVATSQPLAAEAGVELLRRGGNAFDAAVATAAALNVVEPTSTGLGGDVFACYRTADGEVGALRSCGGAPAAATVDAVREAVAAGDDEAPSMPFRGPHTVTVPGTARGWETTVTELGRLTLAECLAPAVEYATEGYPVSEVVADQWTHAEELFTDDVARDTYLFDGRSPRVGETVQLPALGRTLERVGEVGADVVYEGAVGEAIVDAVRSRGGFLSMDDLAAFEPEFLEPISTTYGGSEVYELPPNNQGLVALEALNIASEVGAPDATGTERLHLLAEATKFAFHDGHRYITDPAYETIPPLNSRAWAARRAAEIGDEAARDVSFGVLDANAEDADTVLLCVADDAGNVVSYINSRFAGFGSGIVAGETGIALQNRGASFSLQPTHPNRLEPGKKPFHTLIPALLDFAPDDDTDDWAAFGVMGGYMQPQGHVQVVSNLVDRDLPIQRALDEPRWRYREDGTLAVEARLPGATKLARHGHDVRVLPPSSFGGAQLARNCEGTLSGATEPRKDGAVTPY
ncbi:gamma-glutamyltransferase family protein [Salinigranum salinum]|uniref:gamma-glutamyltransferase family protein n=1 Tax=Salinigranum salinum TaxID=1364937 RepID=UPI001260A2B2|nr:gamma-glutamyltransferase family protein [Salinigranum salinum]